MEKHTKILLYNYLYVMFCAVSFLTFNLIVSNYHIVLPGLNLVALSVVGIQKISQHCVDVLTLDRLEDELCSSSAQAPDQLQPCFQPDCPPRCLSVFHNHSLPQRNHWPFKHIRTIHKLPKNQIPFFLSIAK